MLALTFDLEISVVLQLKEVQFAILAAPHLVTSMSGLTSESSDIADVCSPLPTADVVETANHPSSLPGEGELTSYSLPKTSISL